MESYTIVVTKIVKMQMMIKKMDFR